jgi:hypothetical protein
MSATTITRPQQPAIDHPLLIIERILRDREGLWQQIKLETRVNTMISQMLASSTIALACYGAVIGFWNGPLQAISSAIKLPILFLLTLAICLPTLYLFNLVFGSRLSVRQALALVLVAITVTSVLTLAFAPITLFFLITAPNYEFFQLLNVAILTLTGAIGLSFLLDGMRAMNQRVTEAAPVQDNQQEANVKPAAPTVNMSLLYIWIMLYGFVGTQLGWTLRPFFGSKDMEFAIFRAIEGNFYVHILLTIEQLFG